MRCRGLIAGVWLFLCLAVPACAAERIALVIGNSAYVHSTQLLNPANDARDMADALKQAGFEVLLGIDLDKRGFDIRIREFARALEGANVALLFYAGHGLQVSGRNFLIPVDARLESERDLDFDAVSLDFVMRQMELNRENKTTIVFLDACRDNPLSRNLARTMGTRSASVGQGLAQVQAGVGSFISYSTQPGNVALDGADRNSPFTSALVRRLSEPGRNLTSVMIEVRKDVLATTAGKQVPWDHSALTGEFYFHLASAPAMIPPKPDTQQRSAVERRIEQLEEELKRKSDPQQTQKMVDLAQARERLRSLEEANQSDQNRIFEIHRNAMNSKDQAARNNISRDVGQVQMAMGRRGLEMRSLRERITQLEADLGLADAAAPKP